MNCFAITIFFLSIASRGLNATSVTPGYHALAVHYAQTEIRRANQSIDEVLLYGCTPQVIFGQAWPFDPLKLQREIAAQQTH